jgi:L-ascorbate metabolism protein UlaG (beta-lactamase superfamily)
MTNRSPRITYIGGPTALIEWNGLRLLTNPTFDAAGSSYKAGGVVLRKTIGPAIDCDRLLPLDAVLVSHDRRPDNLDRSGRALLCQADRVVTTIDGAARLGSGAIGLAPWEAAGVIAPGGSALQVVATPARHGRDHAGHEPVVGFVLRFMDDVANGLYVSGDTVWFDGIRDVSVRLSVRTALLFMGGARAPDGRNTLVSFTAAEGALAAEAFSAATIVPLNYEGWEHFSESRREIADTFFLAGLSERLRWLVPGSAADIENARAPGDLETSLVGPASPAR